MIEALLVFFGLYGCMRFISDRKNDWIERERRYQNLLNRPGSLSDVDSLKAMQQMSDMREEYCKRTGQLESNLQNYGKDK